MNPTSSHRRAVLPHRSGGRPRHGSSRRPLRAAVASIAALSLVGSLGCGSDDTGTVGDTGASDAGTRTDTDAVSDVDASDPDIDAAREELAELGLDDDEIAEALEMLGGTGEGSAELVLDGQPLQVKGTGCGTISAGEQIRVEADVEPGYSYVQVRFDQDYNDADGGYRFDEASSVELWLDHDDYSLTYRASSSGGVPLAVWGDERHATGVAVLVPSGERAEAAGPDEQLLEFTIVCDDGHPVRPRPDGVVLPGEEDDEEEEEAEPAELFDPQDGWSTSHLDVEIPDEPGTGIAVANGERAEMIVECRGGPRADEPAEGEVFRFEVHAWGVTGQGVGIEARRSIGSSSRGQRLAEEERVTAFAGGGVGAVGWKVLPDGTTVEPRDWSLATGQLIHVDSTGVVTLRADVTDSLQGEFTPVSIELGARCGESWPN